jgi:dienelactone hydrolase
MTPPRRRDTSPYELFLAMGRRQIPKHRFAGDFADWQAAALPDVLATLGEPPAPIDPQPELIAEYQYDDLVCQRWILDVCDGLAAVALVNRPAAPAGTAPHPAILCWHGHIAAGKDPVMGNDPWHEVAATGTDYGLRMAQAGFVTFAIDWMGRGDLDDRRRPNHRNIAGTRDWCNMYYLHATMLGMTPLGMNLAYGRTLVDFVATLPYVDPDRLGVMGLSGGGTMTLWSALTDSRLKAAEIICYSSLFADFGFRDLNYCGSQITPGLYRLVDVPDLQGLLAPLPLLVDIGAYDECFRVESATRCHERLREIYTAAGAAEDLHLNLFAGGHSWPGPTTSVGFFERYLGASKKG